LAKEIEKNPGKPKQSMPIIQACHPSEKVIYYSGTYYVAFFKGGGRQLETRIQVTEDTAGGYAKANHGSLH
jgi:hypothetical protein